MPNVAESVNCHSPLTRHSGFVIRHSRAPLIGLFIGLTVTLTVAEAFAGDWWDARWPCRREIVFPEGAGAGAFEVAFPTHGLARADAGDVRVVADGEEVPARVFFIDESALVHVVFERRGDAAHFIYWGNPAAAAAKATPIRAGVLIETRGYDGHEIRSLAEMRAAWAAGKSQGLRFVPAIHFANNPLGPNENFLSRYVGFFRAERDGDYVFATDSDDASFLLVDGRLVVEWPGAHGAAGQARFTGTVALKTGVHPIEYLHAQGGGGCLMTAAWQPPGAAEIAVMPPEVFVPVAKATVRGMEKRTAEIVADFLPVNAGQAVLTPDANEYLVKMRFENLTPDASLKEYACRWSFGDGTTSTEISPEHVYLSEGDFDVTLILAKGYDERKTTMRVRVARDWDRETRAIDLREAYYDIVKAYDVARMDARQAYRAMYYFERIVKRDDVVRVGQALLSRANGLDENTLFDAVRLLAEALRIQGTDFKAARTLLLTWEPRMNQTGHAAALALAAGDLDMWHLKDLDAAEAEYRRVIFTYAEPVPSLSEGKADRMTLRKALVRMGDIYRWRHESDKAREFSRKAGSIPVDDRNPVQRTVRAGFLARSIEEFLAAGDMEFAYEYLVTWAWEFPEDQLDGWWTELRVKWLIKNKEYPGGIAEVESLLKMNPKTPYAPTLLWLAADCAEALSDQVATLKLLERILSDYPEATHKDAVLRRIEALRK